MAKGLLLHRGLCSFQVVLHVTSGVRRQSRPGRL